MKIIVDIGTGLVTAADAVGQFIGTAGGLTALIPILVAIEGKFGIFHSLFNTLQSGATKLVGGAK